MTRPILAALTLAALLCACGKYGDPVRRGADRPAASVEACDDEKAASDVERSDTGESDAGETP